MKRVRRYEKIQFALLLSLLVGAEASARTAFDGIGAGTADEGVVAVFRNIQAAPNARARWNGRCLSCHGSTAGGAGNLTAFGGVFRGANLTERVRNASQGTNANLDSDGDGVSNALEMQGCSDPGNAAQTPANLNPIPSHCTETTTPPPATLPPAIVPVGPRNQTGLGANGGGSSSGGTLTAGCGSKQNSGARASGELWLLMAFPAIAWTFMKRKK